jgi:pantoate--beta-alanine ligase
MSIIIQIQALRAILQKFRLRKKTIGFVPTMGALHNGHLALLSRCRKDNDLAVLSIFVNPLQFGPAEDYHQYPREKKNDVLLAKKENIDIIFYPSGKEMYPDERLTYVNVRRLTEGLCGGSRPGHFDGVATVVAKLINIVQPDIMYLGQKDAQQCVVIKQMARDLNFPVKIKVIPTVREKDGLAFSSRNRRLTASQRTQAPVLYQSLRLASQQILQGTRQPSAIITMIKTMLRRQTSGEIDYVACVNADTLSPLERLEGKVLVALSVKFGQTRLIDNIIVRIP